MIFSWFEKMMTMSQYSKSLTSLNRLFYSYGEIHILELVNTTVLIIIRLLLSDIWPKKNTSWIWTWPWNCWTITFLLTYCTYLVMAVFPFLDIFPRVGKVVGFSANIHTPVQACTHLPLSSLCQYGNFSFLPLLTSQSSVKGWAGKMKIMKTPVSVQQDSNTSCSDIS